MSICIVVRDVFACCLKFCPLLRCHNLMSKLVVLPSCHSVVSNQLSLMMFKIKCRVKMSILLSIVMSFILFN